MTMLNISDSLRRDRGIAPSVCDMQIIQEELVKRSKYYISLISDNVLEGTKVGFVLDDALNSSGKMFRLRLLLLCGALGPHYIEKRERLCMLAAMVELTHLASLIHDDIVDNAPYRRGKRSIQSKYGKKAAVYSGDFIIARINYYAAIENLNTSAAILAKTIESMCNGEIGQAVCSYRDDVSLDEYYWNIQGKTGALFKAACQIGAMESGCSDDVVKKLEIFGENLGLMFQLRDDLLDFTSDIDEIGKETHKDFRDGIYTLPVLMALQSSEGKKAILPIMKENAKRRLTEDEISVMEENVIRFGGVKLTCQEIRRLAKINRDILNELDKNNKAVSYIRAMLRQLEV